MSNTYMILFMLGLLLSCGSDEGNQPVTLQQLADYLGNNTTSLETHTIPFCSTPPTVDSDLSDFNSFGDIVVDPTGDISYSQVDIVSIKLCHNGSLFIGLTYGGALAPPESANTWLFFETDGWSQGFALNHSADSNIEIQENGVTSGDQGFMQSNGILIEGEAPLGNIDISQTYQFRVFAHYQVGGTYQTTGETVDEVTPILINFGP